MAQQALVNDDSPIAMRSDHLKLQHQVDKINVQLTQIISMLAPPSHDTDSPKNDPMPFSPPRTSKRLNSKRTPDKYSQGLEFHTQSPTFASATSDLDVGMGGCEE